MWRKYSFVPILEVFGCSHCWTGRPIKRLWYAVSAHQRSHWAQGGKPVVLGTATPDTIRQQWTAVGGCAVLEVWVQSRGVMPSQETLKRCPAGGLVLQVCFHHSHCPSTFTANRKQLRQTAGSFWILDHLLSLSLSGQCNEALLPWTFQ